MKTVFTRSVTALAVLVAVGSALPAQVDPQQPPPGKTTPLPGDKMQYPASRSDTFLASWLGSANDNEITLAQYALGKAQSSEVKQFAQMMIDDHKKLADKLSQAGGMRDKELGKTDPTRDKELGKTDPTRDKELGKTDPTRDMPTDAAGKRPPGAGTDRALTAALAGELDHQALIRELGAKCLENAKRELDQKSGAEFDRCYVGMQIAAHAGLLTMLEVFPNHASESLRRTLEESKPTVKAHLEHAKDLAKKLETGGMRATDPASPDRRK